MNRDPDVTVIEFDDPLSKLAKKYGTDKGPVGHNYTLLYHTLFQRRREAIRNLLEIGVWQGASLKMWSDYFPNAQVWGVEKDLSNLDLKAEEWPRVHIIEGDVTTLETIRKIGTAVKDPLDVIIDDGSHNPADMMIAYDSLSGLLGPGGIYVVEDIQVRSTGTALWVMVR